MEKTNEARASEALELAKQLAGAGFVRLFHGA